MNESDVDVDVDVNPNLLVVSNLVHPLVFVVCRCFWVSISVSVGPPVRRSRFLKLIRLFLTISRLSFSVLVQSNKLWVEPKLKLARTSNANRVYARVIESSH